MLLIVGTSFVLLYLEWMLGSFICKTVSYMQGVSVSASVNTLMAISIERCIAISCPYVSITSRFATFLTKLQIQLHNELFQRFLFADNTE